MLTVTITCQRCSGTGVYERSAHTEPDGTVSIDPCTMCLGAGQLSLYNIDITEITDDLATCKRRLKKIMDKLEVND